MMRTLVLSVLVVLSSKTLACDLQGLRRPYRALDHKTWFYEVEVPRSSISQNEPSDMSRLMPRLRTFRQFYSARLNVDPYALLRAQAKFYRNMPEEYRQFKMVIEKRVGKITRMSCLEAFLMDTHLSQFSQDGEFEGLVFVKGPHARVLVRTNDTPSLPAHSKIIAKVRNLKRLGWDYVAHMHSHPFSLNNSYGDVSGTVIPSGPDLDLYVSSHKKYGLRSAKVLNGFNTITLRPREFRTLLGR